MPVKRLLMLVVLALLVAAPAAAGQESSGQPAGVPVIWEGRELFRVYGSLGPYSAEERARLGVERLERAVREGVLPESLTIRHLETRSELYAGDRLVGALTDEDAAGPGSRASRTPRPRPFCSCCR
jgi:hypothetical protein